jgi:hypothetical protein
MRVLAALLLLLGACSGPSPPPTNAVQPQDLESAAIERGLVRDPKDRELVGLYARDTDRICMVRSGNEYRVGAFVDYGDGVTCSGSGKVTRVGETLHVELGGEGTCGFRARFDGDRIQFPGTVPDGDRAEGRPRAFLDLRPVRRVRRHCPRPAFL